ncbi:MAG: ATP-binding cassette domain-containing protein [Beijerinckiaceae bacterium]|nr:ATP-binding cassette domain-containing protein [Beijerinckiaceae bacterium]
MTPVLEAIHLHQAYPLPRQGLFERRQRVQAVRDVSFRLEEGQTLGIVGESGSGKSTLARLLVALEKPRSGEVLFRGERISGLPERSIRPVRPLIQMIFQDPFGSLDPRMRIGESIAEPLGVAEPWLEVGERAGRVAAMLERVGLQPDMVARYPHQFSGGQRQRIAIARALITKPALLVADEPVSALDVSVQAQILNLLFDLKLEFGLSMVVISHDLAVIRYLCDEVIVMASGQVVEQAATSRLFAAPQAEYTRALMAAMPLLPDARPETDPAGGDISPG